MASGFNSYHAEKCICILLLFFNIESAPVVEVHLSKKTKTGLYCMVSTIGVDGLAMLGTQPSASMVFI